jgi:hypothetical protein
MYDKESAERVFGEWFADGADTGNGDPDDMLQQWLLLCGSGVSPEEFTAANPDNVFARQWQDYRHGDGDRQRNIFAWLEPRPGDDPGYDFAENFRQAYYDDHLKGRPVWPVAEAGYAIQDPQSLILAETCGDLCQPEERDARPRLPDGDPLLTEMLEAIDLYKATDRKEGLKAFKGADGEWKAVRGDFARWAVKKGHDRWMLPVMHALAKEAPGRNTTKTVREVASGAKPSLSGLPPFDSWSGVRMWFLDGETLSIASRGVTKRFHCSEIGLAREKNRRPTRKWGILQRFAEGKGELLKRHMPLHSKAKDIRQVQLLNRHLKSIFGTNADAIIRLEDETGWRTAFTISEGSM